MTAVLPEALMMRGGDPVLIRDELLYVIRQTIAGHPRSAQVQIGPSEIGTPCQRRLGFRLSGTTVLHGDTGAWRPTVGTAVHTWLEKAFNRANRGDPDGRWVTEARVDVGEINGVPITGKSDLYDRVTATEVDWKCVGITTLRAARAGRIDPKYRVQGHLYGRGWSRAGVPVDRVAIFFLPNNGELTDAHFWSEPYDESVAVAALDRATTVAVLLEAVGRERLLPVLETAEDHCNFCPWFLPGATDLTEACPGHRRVE